MVIYMTEMRYGKRKFLPKNSPINIFKLLPNTSFGSGYRKPTSTITRVQLPNPGQNNIDRTDNTDTPDLLTSTKIASESTKIGNSGCDVPAG